MSAGGTREIYAGVIRLFGFMYVIVHTFLSLQIQLQGGAVEDGHQNKGRVSPFSDPLKWLLSAFDLDFS